jgi:hypothetical protein
MLVVTRSCWGPLQLAEPRVGAPASSWLTQTLLLHFVTLFVIQHSPDACPPTGAERRKFYSRTTTEALQEVQQHQHKGAHPYRVVLGEVRHKQNNRTLQE